MSRERAVRRPLFLTGEELAVRVGVLEAMFSAFVGAELRGVSRERRCAVMVEMYRAMDDVKQRIPAAETAKGTVARMQMIDEYADVLSMTILKSVDV